MIAASHRYLQCLPLAEMTANGLGRLLYALELGGGDQDGRGTMASAMVGKRVFVSVLCAI